MIGGKDDKSSIQKILLSIAVLVAAIPLFIYLNPHTYIGSFLRFVVVYLVALVILTFLRRNNVARFFLKILWVPGIAIITFYPFAIAILSVVLSYVVVYILTVVAFEIIPLDLLHYHLTRAVHVYLEITISSLVVAYFYDKVIGIWNYIFFRRNNNEHKRLSAKIMNQSRAKFSLYFLYFIALFILNTARFSGRPVIESEILEKAILESFATFLAFERIISNWKMFVDEREGR